jgi:alpha-tubulin suppressor-like RCC1 family protein
MSDSSEPNKEVAVGERQPKKLDRASELMSSMEVRLARRMPRDEFKLRQRHTSLRQGQKKLDFMLRNRPARHMLVQKNLLTDDSANSAASKRWAHQKSKAKLGDFLAHRPAASALGKILTAPETDNFSVRAQFLSNHFRRRPDRMTLQKKNFLLPSVVEESKEQVALEHASSEPGDVVAEMEEESEESRAARLTHRRSSSAKLAEFMKLRAQNMPDLNTQRMAQVKEREERTDNFELSRAAIGAFIGKRVSASALVQRNVIADMGVLNIADAATESNRLAADLYPSFDEPEPVLVELLEMGEEREIVCVSAGWGHSVALDKRGGVHVFGNASEGRLGLGEGEDQVVAVDCGDNHTVALTGKGRVFSWGQGAWGRLGNGVQDSVAVPFLISDGLSGVNVSLVACGAYHTLLCADNGRDVYAFGWAKNGRLGLGATGDKDSDVVPTPTRLAFADSKEFPKDAKIVKLAAGNAHSACLLDSGQVFTWGQGSYGATGHVVSMVARGNGRVPRDVYEPHVVPAVEDVADVACGDKHTLVVAQQGALVLSWGMNKYGQLGRNTDPATGGESSLTPGAVVLPSGDAVTKVVCGVSNSGLVQGFRAVTFGKNVSGSLGHSEKAAFVQEPQLVNSITDIDTLVLGYSTSIARGTCGEVFTWGDAQFGKLGYYFEDEELPEAIEVQSTPSPHKKIRRGSRMQRILPGNSGRVVSW